MNNYELIEEGLAKIKKYKNTFYNPAQKTNRDISILVISEYFKSKSNIRILDAMSATGLRGLRYLKELNNGKIFFNDINENAISSIQENLEFNGVDKNEITFFDSNLGDLIEKSSKVNITKSDCNVLMCTVQNYFDVIDIDPFGSCSEYMENAFRAVKHNGIICFTSTDKGVLCTNESKCIVKYDTTILKKFSQNEMALRALLSCISRHAAKFGISIEPLISLSLDFYLRVFVRIQKRSEKKVVKDNGLFFLCHCCNAKSTDSKYKDSPIEIKYNGTDTEFMNEIKDVLEKSSNSDGNKCSVCSSKMKICGPFWNKSLHSRDFINLIKPNIDINENRILGIFNYLEQELSTMWYYEIPLLCKKLKTNCIRNKDMLTALMNLGYDVSLTHCDINAFKTTAPLEIVNFIIQLGNKEKDNKIFSTNKDVEEIFAKKYYKGLISSGLGPLALPE